MAQIHSFRSSSASEISERDHTQIVRSSPSLILNCNSVSSGFLDPLAPSFLLSQIPFLIFSNSIFGRSDHRIFSEKILGERGRSETKMYGFEALTFNIHGGYLEAIVRGHRAGLLTAADYNNLCQCESLDDIKMHLSATEYGPYLQNGAIPFQIDRLNSNFLFRLFRLV